MDKYDVIIIGGGPAALSAGIYLARGNKKVAFIEKGAPGGKMVYTDKIENYIGTGTLNGPDLATKMFNHAIEQNVEHIYGTVTKIENKKNEQHIIYFDDKYVEARAIIIATGATEIIPDFIEGIDKFNNHGVSYCAVCDGPLSKGKVVSIIGGGNSAIEEGAYLSSIAKKVYIFAREKNENQLSADKKAIDNLKSKSNVEIIYDANVKSLSGETNLTQMTVNVAGVDKEFQTTALFPYIGLKPASAFIDLPKIKDAKGYIKTDANMMTTVPGVFAIGDVRVKNIRQIATATSDGAIAAKYIIDNY